MQSVRTGPWTKAETGKTLSFYVPASAPIMVPAEKQLGKVVGQRRRKLGFLRLHQQERALGEKTLSWARPSARCLAFGHRGALPASAGPFAAAPPPAPQLQPQALRQQRGPEGGGAPRPASSIFSLGNRDVRKPCLPSTAYANRAIIPRKFSGKIFGRSSMKDRGSVSSGRGIRVSGGEMLSHLQA